MEKSLVREFTGFNSQANGFFGNGTKNGFIRTFKDQKDLGKSRIQNLPSYKKDDLSKRVQMVVIFQAIQIERLSVQIESLRVQLKDSERQLQNYLSYQIQIKELNEQSLQLEQQNMHYKEEIQKLNQICQKMYLELEEMHRKYDHVDLQLQDKLRNSIKQNQALTKQLQDLRNKFSQKTEQITQTNQKLKKKVTFQQSQIQKQQENLKQTKEQVNHKGLEELAKIKEIENQLNFRQVNIIKEIEDKCKMLNNLKTIVRDKMNETEREKSKYKNLQTNFTNRIGELQNIVKLNDAKLKNQLQSMNKEFQMMENKLIKKDHQLSEVKSTYEDRIKQLEKVNSTQRQKSIIAERQTKEIKEKCKKMQGEIDNLKKALDERTRQLSELYDKYNVLQSQFSTELHRVSQDKQIISKKIIYLMKEIQSRTQQLNSLKNVLINLKKQHESTLEQKQKVTQSFKSTIDQLQALYQQMDKEKTINHQAKTKTGELESLVKKLQNDRRINDHQMKGLQDDFNKMNQYKQQLESELNNINSKLQTSQRRCLEIEKTYQHSINKLKSDHQAQLNSLEQKLLNQIQSISKSFDIKSKQISALAQQLLQIRQFGELQTQSITQMIKKIQTSEKLLKQFKSQQQNTIGQNSDKMKFTLSKTNQIFKIHQGWVSKIIQMQSLISLLQNENIKLQSENKLLNFEIVETHKIQSMHKRRDSRTSTDTTSLKSFMNSNSMIQQNQQVNLFLKKHQKDSIISDVSESQPSQRRIFAQIQNKV